MRKVFRDLLALNRSREVNEYLFKSAGELMSKAMICRRPMLYYSSHHILKKTSCLVLSSVVRTLEFDIFRLR